jgi:hypothetical protein
MDPVSVIVSAIAMGASTALKATAGDVIKDSYRAFKELLLRKYGKHGDTAEAVEKLEKNPESQPRKDVLKEELTNAGAHKDQEVVDKSTELLKVLESKSPGVTGGMVGQINAAGGKVVVAGTISGTFNM